MELTALRMDKTPSTPSPKTDNRCSDLLACFSLTFDDELVVHNAKLIRGRNGIFLAFPNRCKCDRCKECKSKNRITAKYCNNCGVKLDELRCWSLPNDNNGYTHIYDDIVHPITSDLRNYVFDEVMEAYEDECRAPGTIVPIIQPPSTIK